MASVEISNLFNINALVYNQLTKRYFINNNQNDYTLSYVNQNMEKDKRLLTGNIINKNIANQFLEIGKYKGIHSAQTNSRLSNTNLDTLSYHRLQYNFSDYTESTPKQYRLPGFMLYNQSTFTTIFTSSQWSSYCSNSSCWIMGTISTSGSNGFYTADQNSKNTFMIVPPVTHTVQGATIPQYGYKFDHNFYSSIRFACASSNDIGSPSGDTLYDSLNYYTGASTNSVLADTVTAGTATDAVRIIPIFLCIDWHHPIESFNSDNIIDGTGSTLLCGHSYNYSGSGGFTDYYANYAINQICPRLEPTQNSNWTNFVNNITYTYGKVNPYIYLTDKFVPAGRVGGASSYIGVTPTLYQTTYTYCTSGSNFTLSDSNEYTMYANHTLYYSTVLNALTTQIKTYITGEGGFISNKMQADISIHEIDWYNINNISTNVNATNNSTYKQRWATYLTYLCNRGTTSDYQPIQYSLTYNRGYLPVVKRSWIWLFSIISASQVATAVKNHRIGNILGQLNSNPGSYNNTNLSTLNYYDCASSGYVYNVYPWSLHTCFARSSSILNAVRFKSASPSTAPAGCYYINGHVYLSFDEGNNDTYLYLTPLTTSNYQEQTIEF